MMVRVFLDVKDVQHSTVLRLYKIIECLQMLQKAGFIGKNLVLSPFHAQQESENGRPIRVRAIPGLSEVLPKNDALRGQGWPGPG